MTSIVEPGKTLLDADDPEPVLVHGEDRKSAFLLICDHAGNAVPKKLGSLGLTSEHLAAHIGWDINAWRLTTALADHLAAPAIGQIYSRLVIDNNRKLNAVDSIAEVSDGVPIPLNIDCQPNERHQRFTAIMHPYQSRIATDLIEARRTGAVCIVSMHTFTPQLIDGKPRPWHIGVISGPDDRVQRLVFHHLERAAPHLVIGNNVPYMVNMESDYTLPIHAEANNLPYVEFEIRNDMFFDRASRDSVCLLMAGALRHALQSLESRGLLVSTGRNP